MVHAGEQLLMVVSPVHHQLEEAQQGAEVHGVGAFALKRDGGAEHDALRFRCYYVTSVRQ